jgi:hypothetical protein
MVGFFFLTVVNLIVYWTFLLFFAMASSKFPSGFWCQIGYINVLLKLIVKWSIHILLTAAEKQHYVLSFSSIANFSNPVLKYLKDLSYLHYFQSVASVKFLVLKRFLKLLVPFDETFKFPDCLFFFHQWPKQI